MAAHAISRFSVTFPAPDACDQSGACATALTRSSSPRRLACSPGNGYSTPRSPARTGGGHLRRAIYKYFTNKRDPAGAVLTSFYLRIIATSRPRSQGQ